MHAMPPYIGLCTRDIQNSSRPDEIVADFFGGSGSTLMAEEQTGRACFTMELDPIYCDVIVRRWEITDRGLDYPYKVSMSLGQRGISNFRMIPCLLVAYESYHADPVMMHYLLHSQLLVY